MVLKLPEIGVPRSDGAPTEEPPGTRVRYAMLVNGQRPPDPYVIGIAERMTTLASFVGRLRTRLPTFEEIRETHAVLRERRRNGALEEILAVVAADISPANRKDLRRQLWAVEQDAACVVFAVEDFLATCPPVTALQQARFERRARRHPQRVLWLAELEDREKDANVSVGASMSIRDVLPGLREHAKRTQHNLRYLARRLRTQFELPLDDAIVGEDGFDGPLVATEPAELGLDHKGDAQILTLTLHGLGPRCLRYANGSDRRDYVRRMTAPGRVLVAAALGTSPENVSSDAFRRARRAVAETTHKHVELRGTIEKPEFSCRVLLSPLLQRLT